MKNRIATIMTALLVTLLLGQIIGWVHAEITPRTITTEKTLSDELTISGTKVRRSLQCKRTDTFSLIGDWHTEISINGTVTINGKSYRFSFNTTKYPLAKVYEMPSLEQTENTMTGDTYDGLYRTSELSIPHYDWDDLNYLDEPGSDYWHVEYDHINNIDSSGSSGTYYDANPNAGTGKTFIGTNKYHLQATKWQLEDVKDNLNIWELITGGAGILATALGLVLTAFACIIIGVMLGALAVLGIAINIFVENVMETEVDDGWSWLCNIKEHFFLWFFRYKITWDMSFGRWRDWTWSFTLYLPGLRCGGGPGRWALMC